MASPISEGSPTRLSGKLSAVFASIAAFLSLSILSNLSVSQNPGERQFTLNRGPNSKARDLVNPSRAPFVTASGQQFTPGLRPSTPDTNVMEPPSFNFGLMYFAALYAVQNFVSIIDRVSAVGNSVIGPCGALPAADTMRASNSKSSSSFANAATVDSSVASNALVLTRPLTSPPQAASICSFACCSLSADLETKSTCPPFFTVCTAAAFPIPLLPPMMIAFISLDGVVVANANVPSKLKCHRVNIAIVRTIIAAWS
mmetsp:Transcript_25379/g.39852  ORF Transcript_25379/g.39852 Transcript_25379/m.39852 type:complete len:257 (-) Transcript_25379:55-825(-)